MRRVDLNCDCGEGFGPYTIGDDDAMLDIVTSANVACGLHGGDPEIMARTFRIAKAKGVTVGAHPGFPDLWGFGRRKLPFTAGEIERLVAYQVGAAMALAAYAGHRIAYVKVHGGLSHAAMEDEAIARAIVRSLKAVEPRLGFLAVAGTLLETVAAANGLAVAREIYADRAYTDEGRLTPRSSPGAVLHDPEEAADRVFAMVRDNVVIAQSGKRIPVIVDSICVHGDTPNAVAMAKAVRARLAAAGMALSPIDWAA